jgi:hypothetical protein
VTMSPPVGGGVVQAFSAHPAEYDALRRRLVPDYDGFYGAVVEVLERVPGELPPARSTPSSRRWPSTTSSIRRSEP